MKKHLYKKILFLVATFCTNIAANTVLGSTLSCAIPLVVNTTTCINLDTDVSINVLCELIQASASFGNGQVDRVIFTSTNANAVRITSSGTWNLTTFNNSNKVIEFAGNARLILQKGAQINLIQLR